MLESTKSALPQEMRKALGIISVELWQSSNYKDKDSASFALPSESGPEKMQSTSTQKNPSWTLAFRGGAAPIVSAVEIQASSCGASCIDGVRFWANSKSAQKWSKCTYEDSSAIQIVGQVKFKEYGPSGGDAAIVVVGKTLMMLRGARQKRRCVGKASTPSSDEVCNYATVSGGTGNRTIRRLGAQDSVWE